MTTALDPALTKKTFNNWLKGSIAVLFARNGLTEFVKYVITDFQRDQLQSIFVQNMKCYHEGICSSCSTANMLECPTQGFCGRRKPCRLHDKTVEYKMPNKTCPRNICHHLKYAIWKYHRFHGPSWQFTDATRWCTDAFEIAKCYLPHGKGYGNKESFSEIDLYGLLGIIVNNKTFEHLMTTKLHVVPNELSKVRDIINEYFRNSASYELSDTELARCLDMLRDLLQDPKYLLHDQRAQDAVNKINQLKYNSLFIGAGDITAVFDEHIRQRISNQTQEAIKAIQEAHEKFMKEPVESFEAARDKATKDIQIIVAEKIEAIQQNVPETDDDLVMGLPPEILRMDDNSIKLYKQTLAEKSVPDYNIRVMIVGHSDVGKTTLKQRLFGEMVDIQERNITKGIEVHVGHCKVNLETGDWIIQEKDGRIDAVYRRLAKLMCGHHFTSNQGDDDNQPEEVKTCSSNDQPDFQERALLIQPVAPEIKPLRMSDETKAKYTNETSDTRDKKRCLADLKEILKQTLEEDKIRHSAELSIWDFAGQSDFYAMHQVFLSRRSVYILVTKLSEHFGDPVKEDCCLIDCTGRKPTKISDLVEFWLNSIYEHSQIDELHTPNVILVGTHADKIQKSIGRDPCSDFFATVGISLCKKVTFDLLTNTTFDIDNTVDHTNPASKIKDLRKHIIETAKQQMDWGKRIPAKWSILENILINLLNDGTKVLQKEDVLELSKAMPVEMQSDEIELFLIFHHESGNFIYYSNEHQLKENIILEPQWLIDALKSIMESKLHCSKEKELGPLWDDFEKTAVLPKALIDSIWKQSQYSDFQQHSELILCIMEKLGLIAKLNDTKINEEYLVPHFLSKKAPMDIFKNEEEKYTSKLCLTTPTGFLPITIFNKLLAACIHEFRLSGPLDRKQIYCGCGVFDLENGHRLLICFHDNIIYVWLSRLSTGKYDPLKSECLRTFQFVLNILEKDLNKIDITYKCPSSSIDSEFRFRPGNLPPNTDVICYCHKNGHPVRSWEITNYWQNNSEGDCNASDDNSFGERDKFVFNLGQKWHFIDVNGRVESVIDTKAKANAADGVCTVKGPKGQGTGFRVGDRSIMTAAHVIGNFVPIQGVPCDTSCHAEFNFIHKNFETKIFHFTNVVYRNDNLDVAVVELCNCHIDLPPAFQYFCHPVYDRPFFFIGHSQGKMMEINEVDKTIRIEDDQNRNQLNHLQSESIRLSGKDYDPRGAHNLLNPYNYLFLCKFTHGASGSPGCFVNDGIIYVTTMLLAGLPWWYYDDGYTYLKSAWKESGCVEQGLNMKSLYNAMRQSHPNLCQEVFGRSHQAFV